MLDTENRCKSSLAFSHLRWTVGVRVVLLKRSIALLQHLQLHLQRCFPLCELATNTLHYSVFCLLKPLKTGRYHDRDKMWKVQGVHLRLYLHRYDGIFEETSPLEGAPQDHASDGARYPRQ